MVHGYEFFERSAMRNCCLDRLNWTNGRYCFGIGNPTYGLVDCIIFFNFTYKSNT